ARDAQPWASPCDDGIATSTASRSSRAMPQSSMARLAASSAKPIALVPGSLPKRDRPIPAMAYRSRRRALGLCTASPAVERRHAHDLRLARLVLGPDVAVDEACAVGLPHRRHRALAGDHVARPGELREAGAELAHRRRVAAGGLHHELAEVPHRQHAVREDPGMAGVACELLIEVDRIRVAGGGGVLLEVVLRDRALYELRQRVTHLHAQALREIRMLRE